MYFFEYIFIKSDCIQDIHILGCTENDLTPRHACGGSGLGSHDVSVSECMKLCNANSDCNCITWFHNNVAKCLLETGPNHSDRNTDIYSAMTVDEAKSCGQLGEINVTLSK